MKEHERLIMSDYISASSLTAHLCDIEVHEDIRKHFWDPEHWPKYVLVRYTWEERSEIDVAGGFYFLFGSGLVLSFVLSIYVLQSSQEKLARFVRETVAETNDVPEGGVAEVE